jgi:hypothetical protein
VIVGAALALVALTISLGFAVDGRQAALALVGAGLGIALYHASFGFTAAYRRFIAERRGAGVRAQAVMLGVAALAFAPLLVAGEAFGRPLSGALAPIGLSLLIGAFIFGIGMQLAGGCASGTLYTVGGGSTRMLIVLAAFVAGSYFGTWHLDWWQALPTLEAVSLYGGLGWAGGLGVQAVILGALCGVTVLVEIRRHGTLEPVARPVAASLTRLVRGPWPLLWGAVALALLNVATLLIAGRPWGITSAFALWGAKLAKAAGGDPGYFAYWRRPGASAALDRGLEHDVTSVMNVGLVIGALLAAGLAGRFAPALRIGGRSALAALTGGLMLGYGARLAYGCNIGAFFSGAASGSLHGWVWLLAALAGTFVGVRLRPFFGLPIEPAG